MDGSSSMASQQFILMFLPSLILFLLLPSSATSQSTSNLTLGSFLVAGDDSGNNSWVSPSGDFAFGFYSLGTDDDCFLLAIWYNLIPEKTIVWSANRNTPVQRGSRVELTSDGNLQLQNKGNRSVTWSSTTSAEYGAMLDTGNFVLGVRGQSYAWQSFQHPTDTLLPSQVLYYNEKKLNLTSKLTKTNYSHGRFALKFEDSGNLRLWTVDHLNQEEYDFYWEMGNSITNSRLVYNEFGYMTIFAPNGTELSSLTKGQVLSANNYYHRAVLDYDGVVRQYFHPKNTTTSLTGDEQKSWGLLLPVNIPDQICNGRWGSISSSAGSGVCAFNTICRLNDSETQTYSCDCIIGYSNIDDEEPWKGCRPNVFGGDCSTGFEIVEQSELDWPSKRDYSYTHLPNAEACRISCQEDCFCYVSIFNGKNGKCFKKSLPLSNGRERKENWVITAFIKVWENHTLNNRNDPIAPSGRKYKYKSWVIGTSTALGTSLLLIAFLLLFSCPTLLVFDQKKKQKTSKLVLHADPNDVGLSNLHCFSYRDLEAATNGFKEELGHGSFGTVYKGVVSYNHQIEISIAVKKLNKVTAEEGEKEFRAELNGIGQTHHRNLVKLVGYCNEATNRALVYEFMSNGSLASLIFGVKKPSLSQRSRMAVAVAKGLAYLHEDCSTPIIHCDIKSQNILLDENLEAKIADFGLSKLLKKDQSKTCTDIRGTRGYVAPEWFRKGSVTTKVDIYSFGVLLLEILFCRRSFEPDLEQEGAAILVDWAYDCHIQGHWRNALFSEDDKEDGTKAIDNQKEIEKMLMVGIWCVQEDVSLRPSIRKVVLMLEESVEVPPPLDPSCNSD